MNRTAPTTSDIRSAFRGAIVSPAGVLPPAALATSPAEHLSDKYEFINTAQVVEMMTEEGFTVAESAVRRPRAPGGAQLGMHVIDFRHPAAPAVHGTVPRVLFINSHDGSRRASVRIGAFRLVCSNGMVTGETIAHAVVRHAGSAARELVERMRALSRNTVPMFEQIERWTKRDLTASQQHDFARLATQLRWGRPDAVSTDELLTVRRAGDDAGDLWTVFNRVQEATTRLALPAVAASGRLGQTRPLLEAGINLRYNAELWQLAEEFAAL